MTGELERLLALAGDKFKEILKSAPSGCRKLSSPSLPGAMRAISALSLKAAFKGRDVFAVSSDSGECEAVYSDLHALKRPEEKEPVLLLPPTCGQKRDFDSDGMRVEAARALLGESAREGEGNIFVTTSSALLFPLPNPCETEARTILLEKGESPLPFGEYAARLVSLGYARTHEVTAKSEFALRGGIIDFWPNTSPLPVRVDFFGDEIDSISSFDPQSQRSVEKIPSVRISPSSLEEIPSAVPASLIKEGSVLLWLEGDLLQSSTRLPGEDAPSEMAFEELKGLILKSNPALEIFSGEIAPAGAAALHLEIKPPPGLSDIGRMAFDPMNRLDARKSLFGSLKERASKGENVLVAIDTLGGLAYLEDEIGPGSGIKCVQAVLSGGFSWEETGLTLLAQPDVYSTRKVSGRRLVPPSIAHASERVSRPEELRRGDLVVHIDYGIGRFLEISSLPVSGGAAQEVLSIQYADGVKLHVPVSQSHLVSRYVGVSGKDVQLHRIGTKRWKTECAKAEKSVFDLAATLLETQARRSASQGFAFDPNPQWMDLFEASFPYRETADQKKCIDAVKSDMASPRPMDRLICGDAGYGKTEIAMRAAFIAVMNGKQVAVLAPTTILSEQHFASFKERMAPFPVRIEVVNRLRSQRERERALEEARRGSVDILVGTHSIVQPGVSFKDLGLLVIDEEQRFGVAHKERLKGANFAVDVLTLSATPIPRTLYMSMIGARDMSLLQTPPVERLEIETEVERDSDSAIKNAVLREMKRNGQVFFLHNRVLTMGIMLRRLRSLLPGARIAEAHGQMNPGELRSTMAAFEAGEYDVLLSTTIVENGLDIPRANTIIIHRADRFGLATLYQLRGRVGRASRRGYALLLIPEQGIIDRDARERIKALKRHGGLSGGLNLALRDLEIRGAGNMLGAEQSGHIAAVGFELYCQLLKRTVARIKGEKPPEIIDVALLLDFVEISPGGADADEETSASIPYGYIPEDILRMGIHRKMAEAGKTEEIRALAEEMEDRFGALPLQTKRLLRLAELRIIAAAKKISRIEVKDDVVRPYDMRKTPIPGPGGKFFRIKGKTVDQKISSLFKAISQTNTPA